MIEWHAIEHAYTAMTAFLKIAAQLTKQRTEYFNIKNALHLYQEAD